MKQKSQIEQRRETFVVKSNDLIQRTTYMLTTSQQKMLLYMISFVKPDDKPDTEYLFSINSFLKVAGLDLTGGRYYSYIKEDIKALRDKSAWISGTNEKGETISRTLAWIKDPVINENRGEVIIQFSDIIAPYLFEIKEKYTKYSLENVLAFKSKYTIRMYELLKSYERMKTATIQVDRLREMMRTEKIYPLYADFKRKVIDTSVREICMYSRDIDVSYTEIKKGKRVYELEFKIWSKLPRTPEDQETGERVTARLDKHMSQHNGKLNE